MNVLTWIILGGLAGWIASLIMGQRQGCLANVVIGVIGALVGGLLFQAVGQPSLSGLNFWSIFVAVIGSIILIAVFRALQGPRA